MNNRESRKKSSIITPWTKTVHELPCDGFSRFIRPPMNFTRGVNRSEVESSIGRTPSEGMLEKQKRITVVINISRKLNRSSLLNNKIR